MSDPLYAALDLGSNTFRLILAEADQFGLVYSTKRVFQEIPRLSEGLVQGKPFGEAALKRAWDVLEVFQRIILDAKPQAVLAGATMAARIAVDGKEFLREIEGRFDWQTKLLSGPAEAYLSASGVLSGLDQVPGSAVIFDIGGRSTEFISVHDKTIARTQSLDIGVVGLTEAYIHSDPPTEMELLRVEERVQKILQSADWEDYQEDSVLIGTAGTITTIAAMLLNLAEYSPRQINNSEISGKSIRDLLIKLKGEPLAQRRLMPGLHPGRADVIIAGLILALEILTFFQRKSLIVSDNGLLEGLWLLNARLIPLEL
jgi:exopolyphosphatase/guanosine-5'-triphosphate,3'-diphosphate pyrophosphatase